MTTTSSARTTTETSPTTIEIVTAGITFYAPMVLLIIGVIGCVCNLITFTSPQLRKNSCAFYFLISTVFELLSITFGLISRLAADHFGSTLNSTDRAYCKMRAYLVSALPLIATYLVLLSSIDRCLSSSVSARLRSFSQLRVAYRASVVAIAVGFISCAHILVGYDLRPRCGPLRGTFGMYDSMFVVFWLGVIPHVLMLVFGLLTIMNVRRTKRRIAVQPVANAPTTNRVRREQKTDAQLIIMMLVQVGISSLLILTRVIYYAYYVLAPPLTGYNKLIGSFLMSFTVQLYYANYAKSFYIYTLSSQFFRSAFLQRMKYAVQEILRRHAPTLLLELSLTNNERAGGTQHG